MESNDKLPIKDGDLIQEEKRLLQKIAELKEQLRILKAKKIIPITR